MKIGIYFGGVIIKASEGEPFNAKDGLSIKNKNALFVIRKLLEKNTFYKRDKMVIYL